MARQVYTGKPGSCGGTFTVDADVAALTVYSASITLPSPVEGAGASRSDTHKITVDVFGGAQMAYLGSVDLVTKVHTLPADTVTGSDYSSTWVATTPYPTARRIVLRGTHLNSTTGQTNDGFRFDVAPEWGPSTEPYATIIAQGTVDLGSVGSPAELEYRVFGNGASFTTLEGNTIWQYVVETRQKPGSGYPPTMNLAVDVLDDRGNWIEVAASTSSAAWRNASWFGPMGWTITAYVSGATPYTGKFPGTAMPTNPTKIRVRQTTDPVGYDRYGTTDILYQTVTGPTAPEDILFAVKLGFDVSMDTYKPGTTSVTGDTPAITDGTNTVVAVPNPTTGGVDIKRGDGTVVGTTGPLPGGPVNGPITLRIDNGNLLVIYDGDVIWAWKISDLPWWDLNLSTVYVGIWNPTTHVVSTTTAVMPPLGGWRYRLFGQIQMPGLRPRLFGVWAHTWMGVTWVTDATSAYETGDAWESDLATDPTVTVYPGGQEWLITADEATKIARAGGLEQLTEVVP